MCSQKTKAGKSGLQIESTMKSIEKLLEELENPETPLDVSLARFEEGIGLIRQAQKQLAEAEQKVQILLEDKGKVIAQEFELGDEDD